MRSERLDEGLCGATSMTGQMMLLELGRFDYEYFAMGAR